MLPFCGGKLDGIERALVSGVWLVKKDRKIGGQSQVTKSLTQYSERFGLMKRFLLVSLSKLGFSPSIIINTDVSPSMIFPKRNIEIQEFQFHINRTHI